MRGPETGNLRGVSKGADRISRDHPKLFFSKERVSFICKGREESSLLAKKFKFEAQVGKGSERDKFCGESSGGFGIIPGFIQIWIIGFGTYPPFNC